MKIKTLLVILLYMPILGMTQEEESKTTHHKIALVLGHTHIPTGVNSDGNKEWIILPSWGLDYDYRFDEKWSIGLHSDLVIENFEYENSDEIILERSRPLALVLTGSRKFGEHLTLVAGGGLEIAKEEDLKLVRIGIDYGWELPDEWELSASLMSDFKIGAYNSWVLGLGIVKLF